LGSVTQNKILGFFVWFLVSVSPRVVGPLFFVFLACFPFPLQPGPFFFYLIDYRLPAVFLMGFFHPFLSPWFSFFFFAGV